MATRLELAKNKLKRLQGELHEASEKAFSHMRLTNGQPMNDKRGGRAFMNRQGALENKAMDLTQEIRKQEKYIEKLEHREECKKHGLNANGGLKISVENLDIWKKRVADYEFARKYNKENGLQINTPVETEDAIINYDAAKLKKAREAVEKIENIKKLSSVPLENKYQKLVDDNKINQWKSKPSIYFVKGLRKVALENDGKGGLVQSKKYYPKNENEEQIVKDLLK